MKHSRYFYIALLAVSITINHVATVCTMESNPIDDQLMEEVSRKDNQEDVDLVRGLIESGANPNAPDVFLVRPLHMAARYNHGAYVTLLLEKGAAPCAIVVNVFMPNRYTPLHYAALSNGGDSSTKALLADSRVDINARTDAGKTPLMFAAQWNIVALNALLADRRTRENRRDIVDAQSDMGFTALHTAVSNGKLAAATALIGAGASVNTVNAWGKTPLDLAESEGRLSEHHARYAEIADYLRSVGGKRGQDLAI